MKKIMAFSRDYAWVLTNERFYIESIFIGQLSFIKRMFGLHTNKK
ncbi:hypothetical protein KUL10_22530 [Glaciecola sp. KUL10]|nr:hypothetical protein KUL10_22530 [Glaciecola sp. KUL10]